MSATKLHIINERMLQLMDYCISNSINGVKTQKEWCEIIGMPGSNNIFNIRVGKQQFTNQQILQACIVFNISTDYIFGFTDQMARVVNKLSPLERIKEAIRELEGKGAKTIKFIPKKKVR